MGFGAVMGLLSAGTSVLGAVSGYRDANLAAKSQKGYIDKAIGEQDNVFRQQQGGVQRGRAYMEEILGISQTIEDDLLGQLDAQTAGEVRRIRQESMQADAMVQQQMAGAGMDSFTTMQGAQATTRGQASNALSELAMRASDRRSRAITTGRSAEMGANAQLGSYELQSGQILSQAANAKSQIYGNIQINPANSAQGIGQLGGSIADLYRTSVLEDALKKP